MKRGRKKTKKSLPPGESRRGRRMKKALAGPAKRTAKKPVRRAMIAAARQAVTLSRRADRAVNRVLVGVTRVGAWTAAADRRANALLLRAWPPLERLLRRLRRLRARAWRRLRPLAVLLFRALALFERGLLRARRLALRAATRASAALTPRRAICLTILAAAGCLVASQFVEYRAVEVGQPGYSGLAEASAPRVGGETAGQAHSYLLVPVALLAAALALAALRNERRDGLGRVVFALGLLSLGVALLVDLPAGLDAGAQEARFAGATAVLENGFYAQVASAVGLMLGGALLALASKAAARYHARPCRTRTSSFAKVASGLRRRLRRRASSRGRGARRASPRRKGAASAPASPR